jgi:hypothetical protein
MYILDVLMAVTTQAVPKIWIKVSAHQQEKEPIIRKRFAGETGVL